MRKNLFYLLLLSSIACGNSLFAQHITAHTISYPPSNNCPSLKIDLAVDAAPLPGDSLNMDTYWGDGKKDHMSIQADSTVHFSHIYDFSGVYTIKNVLLRGAGPTPIRVDSVAYSLDFQNCQTVRVQSFYDVNNNCLFDGADKYLTLPVTVEVDSANVAIDTLVVNGGFYYPMHGSVGTIYKFKILKTIPGTLVNCPANGIITDTISTIVNAYAVKSFSLISSATGNFDLAGYVTVRAGSHHACANILVTNNSSLSQNATLVVNFSNKYDYQSASPAPQNVNGHTVTWYLPSLSMSSAVNIRADFEDMTGPQNNVIGDTVLSSYYLTPTIGDAFTMNNVIIHTDTIVGSYDPNYKDVTPNGNIIAGAELSYTVEFENTGNDTAFNIYILDTLSDNVLPSTLDILASSARMDFSLNKIASGRYVAKFDFPGINLLDSSHHDACTGNVIYTIRTKDGLAPGTYISNRAGIYFDDNEVVMTDYAVNKIGLPQSVTTIGNVPSAMLYPNPATDILTIKTNANAFNSLEINNTIGQLLIRQQVTQSDTEVNVKNLPSGIYTITLKGDAGTKTLKFEKQ